MTREELDAFLTRVGASSLNEYLGVANGENPAAALEERMRWAAWHFSDPQHGTEAEFVMTYASQIRSILDEGEPAWRARTEQGNVKMGEALQNRRNQERLEREPWSALPAFLTPPVAPPRDIAKTVLSPEESGGEGQPDRLPPRERLSDEERIKRLRAKLEAMPLPAEDATDPIGFQAATLPEGARLERAYTPPGRVRRGVGPGVFEVPPDPGVATGAHAFVDWERLGQSSDVLPTDPGVGEPDPDSFDPDEHSDEITIPFVDVTEDEDNTTPTVPAGPPSRWIPTAFVIVMAVAFMVLLICAVALTMFELGRRHGAAEVRREVPTSVVLPEDQ